MVAALLQCDWRGNFHPGRAPYIQDDFTYREDPEGKLIRIYDSVDVRFLLEDFFSKLALCYGRDPVPGTMDIQGGCAR